MSLDITINKINDHVQHIVIDRNEAKNALTSEMYLSLAKALEQADNDISVRAVLLSGNAQMFCAGNDLNDFLNNPPRDSSAPPFKFLLALHHFSKPLIAATAGPAIGIGTTMLLHCDHVLSATNTVFKMPFLQLGLTPEGGSSLLLPQLIGQRQASELLLLGKSFDTVYALQIGLINQQCAVDDLMPQAISVANHYAQQAPSAVQQAKKLLKAPLKHIVEQAILEEGTIFSQRVESSECKEAISAFFEKRQPTFN